MSSLARKKFLVLFSECTTALQLSSTSSSTILSLHRAVAATDCPFEQFKLERSALSIVLKHRYGAGINNIRGMGRNEAAPVLAGTAAAVSESSVGVESSDSEICDNSYNRSNTAVL